MRANTRLRQPEVSRVTVQKAVCVLLGHFEPLNFAYIVIWLDLFYVHCLVGNLCRFSTDQPTSEPGFVASHTKK